MTISISSEAQKNWNIQTGKMGWWSSCSVVSHNKRERERERLWKNSKKSQNL